MIATVEYLTELFWECNKVYFDNTLPTPYIELFDSLKHIARFEYSKNKKGSKKPIRNQIIKFTKNYDFDENIIRDIMVHEMIHYYIAWNRIKDNKAHGKQFMEMAEEYNQKYVVYKSNNRCFPVSDKQGSIDKNSLVLKALYLRALRMDLISSGVSYS